MHDLLTPALPSFSAETQAAIGGTCFGHGIWHLQGSHSWAAGAGKTQFAARTAGAGGDALAGEAPAATANKPRTQLSRPAVECPSAEEARVMMVRAGHHHQVLSTEVCWVPQRTVLSARDCYFDVLCSLM